MQPFTLVRPATLAEAVRLAADAEILAGGTDMLQLMKEYVRRPARLVDVTGALSDTIEVSDRGARIGAGATMEQVATHPGIAATFPVVSEALLESASVQVRNLATIGGNLLQRTRCGYFRDIGVPACNKRRPGSGCAALGGENRILAVLGTSEQCIATHASDLAVALAALAAEVVLTGAAGERRLRVDEIYRPYGDRPDQETVLRPDEIITAVEIATTPAGRRSRYLKVRDRASFEWALLSAAVAMEVRDGAIQAARVAMGGVGTKPWRMPAVEAALQGRPPGVETYEAAARHAMEGARGYGQNDFKIEAAPRVLARALALAGDDA